MAPRRLAAGLRLGGWQVYVLIGASRTDARETAPAQLLAAAGYHAPIVLLNPPSGSPPPDWPYPPSQLRIDDDGVHLLRGPATRPHEPEPAEVHAFAALLGHLLDHHRPDALIAQHADPLTAAALQLAPPRPSGSATEGPTTPAALAADRLLAPSQTLADEFHEATGRPCGVLPDFLDPDVFRPDPGTTTLTDATWYSSTPPPPAG